MKHRTPENDLADALDIDNLAASILKISKTMEHLLNHPGGLRSETIVLLLHEQTKIGKKTIEKILKALPQLHSHYCREP